MRVRPLFALCGEICLHKDVTSGISDLHDHIVVQADGRTLMGIPQTPHGHCDKLALRAVVTCASGHWKHFTVRTPDEVVGFVLRPRDGQCMRGTVEDAESSKKAVPELR